MNKLFTLLSYKVISNIASQIDLQNICLIVLL